MKKVFLTVDEIYKIRFVAFSKNIDITEKANMIHNIISYDDFMELWDNYVYMNFDLEKKLSCLMLSVYSIFSLYERCGLFKSIDNTRLVLQKK